MDVSGIESSCFLHYFKITIKRGLPVLKNVQ